MEKKSASSTSAIGSAVRRTAETRLRVHVESPAGATLTVKRVEIPAEIRSAISLGLNIGKRR
jgi:hypothetical protein